MPSFPELKVLTERRRIEDAENSTERILREFED